ncbi:WD40 repeat domain-containing serine/threonine protein kinase [Actinomadura scrupuli]|uniref:WD40 repeat domain-containing serine/threonine protein kinase n=1 Tax=Actinomadura scrupuli TaxID=559629 RepID=UPI003D9789CA
MSEVGPLQAGDPQWLNTYRLLGRLGSGGQGTVYLGADPAGQRVAIKVLHSRLAGKTRARERFLREVTAARAVAPFCTAQVLDVDVVGDEPYIVSEYIDGVPLSRLVAEHGPRDAGSVERLAIGTAAALAAIHRAGIVHRDFKPSNVLCGSDGPRVIDFGIARALDLSVSQSTETVGTPAYMSPEQISGQPVGPSSDVFSWAVTMVYAATGAPAFGTDTIAAVFGRILYSEPDLSEITGPLRPLLVSCLNKDAAERPTTTELMLLLVGHDRPQQIARSPSDDVAPSHQTTVTDTVITAPPGSKALPGTGPRRRLMGLGLIAFGLVAILLLVSGWLWHGQQPTTAATRPAGDAFGAPIGRPLTGHTAEVISVAGGTVGHRPVAVSGSFDTTIRVWDVTTARPIGRPLTGHTNAVAAVALTSLGGRPVAISGSDDRTIRLWDLTGERPTRAPIYGPRAAVWVVVPATVGGRPVIVSAGVNGTIETWDPASGTRIGNSITANSDDIGALAVTSLDGRPAVAAPSGNAIRLWDLTTGARVGRPMTGHTGMVMALAAGTLNGHPILVSGGQDHTVRVWDVTSGTEIGAPFTGHTLPVGALAITELDDHPIAISGSDDRTVRVWDLTRGNELGRPFTGHTGPVRSVSTAIHRGHPVALSAGNDKTVRIWGLGPPYPSG